MLDLITVTQKFYDEIKASTTESDLPPNPAGPLTGVRIMVIENSVERRVTAMMHSMETGKAVLYEDENGGLCEVKMPKASSMFPTHLYPQQPSEPSPSDAIYHPFRHRY